MSFLTLEEILIPCKVSWKPYLEMKLKGKNILIVSPEKWGDIFVSKHHYALELSKLGNRVFFLNQPKEHTPFTQKVVYSRPENALAITVINYTYPLKGHLLLPSKISSYIYKNLIQKIEKEFEIKLDIIWCFDTSTFSHWEFAEKNITKILHIVDLDVLNNHKKLFSQADFIFASSHAILKKIKKLNYKAFFINHGLALQGFDPKTKTSFQGQNVSSGKAKVGYVGNLLVTYIDWEVIKAIVNENPGVNFHFFGPFEGSNLGINESGIDVRKELGKFQNVILEGKIPSSELLKRIKDIDLFLIAYNSEKHLEQLANPHKVLELLVTGKTIVSSFMLEYEDKDDLLKMARENSELPAIFKNSLGNLCELNNEENQQLRINYAMRNTYEKQISRIEKIIYG